MSRRPFSRASNLLDPGACALAIAAVWAITGIVLWIVGR